MTKPRRSLNSMRMQANGRGEILIYDQIGGGWFEEGVTDKGFVQQLAELGNVAVIDLRINSPGGEVSHGLAIYNALVKHPAQIEVHIDGLAASMATVIAMAGDKIHMAQNALFMIHEPRSWAGGTAEELRSEAAVLDTMNQNAIDIYASRSGGDPAEIKAAMAKETWYSAEGAKAAGFVDVITPNKTVTAPVAVDSKLMLKAPAWAKTRLTAMCATLKGPAMAVTRADLTPVSETEESTSGDLQNAEGTVVGTWSLTPAEEPSQNDDDEDNREQNDDEDDDEEPAARKAKAKKGAAAMTTAQAQAAGATAERDRMTKITALCKQAKQPEMAAQFCEDPDCTVEEARRQLFNALCRQNPPVGDAGGNQPGKQKANADGNDKYRQEYRAEPAYAKRMSEDEYIQMRRIDDRKDSLRPGSKVAAK